MWGVTGEVTPSDGDVLNGVAARLQEFREVLGGNRKRQGVDVGVKRQPGGGLEVAVERHSHLVLAVVDEAEGRDGSGGNAEMGHQTLRGGETQLAVPDLSGDR